MRVEKRERRRRDQESSDSEASEASDSDKDTVDHCDTSLSSKPSTLDTTLSSKPAILGTSADLDRPAIPLQPLASRFMISTGSTYSFASTSSNINTLIPSCDTLLSTSTLNNTNLPTSVQIASGSLLRKRAAQTDAFSTGIKHNDVCKTYIDACAPCYASGREIRFDARPDPDKQTNKHITL